MIGQLSQTYDVPRSLSERWVQQGRVLPLLDGLDEMEEAARPACISAINEYHHAYLTPLVVCSRQGEYETAASKQRLVLQGAVIVQPLSETQITTTLREAGPSFDGLQAAWSQEPDLRELAMTPLMLSVQLLTYRSIPASEIPQRGEERERQVWTDYVKRQVQEKGNDTHYPLERTYAWLTFLARQMRVHQQTTFYAEYLGTDWLSFKQQRTAVLLATYLPALLIGACASLLVFTFLGGGIDLAGIVQWGAVGGSVGVCVCQYLAGEPRQSVPQRSYAKSLGLAVLFGALSFFSDSSYYSFYSIDHRIRDSCLFGLGGGLGLWLFQACLSGLLERPMKRKNQRSFWQGDLLRGVVSMAPSSVWHAAACLGGAIGLAEGLSVGLTQGLNVRLSTGLVELSVGLSMGLGSGLRTGLSVSVAVILIYVILGSSMGSLRLAERISWKWRRALHREHLRTSLTIMGLLFLFFVLGIGLSEGLRYGLINGQRYGLINGLCSGLINGLINGLHIGLSTGLSAGLSYLILLGLYRGITQEHLEDQHRQQFNQGVRRSLRNGLILALISASIITILGVLSYGLGEGLFSGLSEGLSEGLIIALSFWQVLFSASLVIMWALSGGLTVLLHYVIRWLLAQHRTFPFRAQAFLDDATTRILLRRVGGGYSFIHRRLQDYFADLAPDAPLVQEQDDMFATVKEIRDEY